MTAEDFKYHLSNAVQGKYGHNDSIKIDGNKLWVSVEMEEDLFLDFNVTEEFGFYAYKSEHESKNNSIYNFISFDFVFESCSFRRFRLSYYSANSIEFNGCNFLDNFSIINIELSGDLIFVNCKFDGIFILESTPDKYVNSIYMYKNIFNKDLELSSLKIDNIEISRNTLNQHCKINSCTISTSLVLDGGEFQDGVIVDGNSIVRMFSFRTEDPIKLIANKIQFEQISFENISIHKDSEIQFVELILPLKISFDRVINNGKIVFNSLKVSKDKPASSLFSINQSIFGLVYFINCSLELFEFDYRNSSLLSCCFINTILPNEIVGDRAQARIFFSQIKKAYEQNGDILLARKYHAREVEYFRRSLGKVVEIPSIVVLWMNKVSSGHGEKWLSAVLFTVISGFVTFIPYWYLYDYRQRVFFMISAKFWAGYIKFIFPGRGFEIFKDYDPSFGQLLLDVFGRILISYGIYQTIQAFRKHGKK